MKSHANIQQMIFVLDHLHFDCPMREAARMGGIRMLLWALQPEDEAMPPREQQTPATPTIH